jgi:hypothetical protein
VLLIASAFLIGLDISATSRSGAVATVDSVVERSPLAGDDAEPPHRGVDRLVPSRRRLPEPPPPSPATATTGASRSAAAVIVDRHPWRHVIACSPKRLQKFRC